MKVSLALSALSTLRAAQALVVPAADSINAGSPETTLEDIHWEVFTNVPGAAPLEIDGTIEQLDAQLSAINANYLRDFNITTVLADSDTDAPVATTPKHKRSENTVAVSQYKDDAIRDGIKYLRGLKGVAKLARGPNRCSRVSCSYNSGIHVCNDDPKYPKLVSFKDIADDAERALEGCPLPPKGWENEHPERIICTHGGVFHWDARWRVRITEDEC